MRKTTDAFLDQELSLYMIIKASCQDSQCCHSQNIISFLSLAKPL